MEAARKTAIGRIDRNRAKGMLWGLVVGDCLGSPVQFMPKDDHPWITEMVPCRRYHAPAGSWTDDSSMAFCIMESFARLGRYDRADIARNFVRWFQDGFWSSLRGRAFDVGQATWDACQNMAFRGSLVNGREDSLGNGSIMRLAPAYLLSRGERSPRRVVHEINDLTHNSGQVRKVADSLVAILDAHMAGRRTRERSAFRSRGEVLNLGLCSTTLEAALWAFETTETFEDGMVAAVNLGGDADTIGAVYGQIAGAYYGYRAIPGRWLAAIRCRRRIAALVNRFLAALDPETPPCRFFKGEAVCPYDRKTDYSRFVFWKEESIVTYGGTSMEYVNELARLGDGIARKYARPSCRRAERRLLAACWLHYLKSVEMNALWDAPPVDWRRYLAD